MGLLTSRRNGSAVAKRTQSAAANSDLGKHYTARQRRQLPQSDAPLAQSVNLAVECRGWLARFVEFGIRPLVTKRLNRCELTRVNANGLRRSCIVLAQHLHLLAPARRLQAPILAGEWACRLAARRSSHAILSAKHQSTCGGQIPMSTATKAKQEKASSEALKLQPLGDRVVVEREESEAKTAGGIVLPDSAKDKPSRGTVIASATGAVGRRHAQQAASQGRRQGAVHLLRPRDDQAQRPRTAVDARRRHPGRHRISTRTTCLLATAGASHRSGASDQPRSLDANITAIARTQSQSQGENITWPR